MTSFGNVCHPAILCLVLLLVAVTTLALGIPAVYGATDRQSPTTCNESGDGNDLLYCVWLAEPRFAGFAMDLNDSSRVSVWLNGDESTEAALGRVLTELNRLWGRGFTTGRSLRTDHTIGELKGWFDDVAADPPEGMTGLDLDESANRLAVFAPDLEDDTVSALETHLADLEVPSTAWRIEHRPALTIPTPPEAPTSQGARRSRRSATGAAPISEQRLDQGLNPFVGGGQILFDNTYCSAGFTVAFVNLSGEYERGFVTAGHCGEDQDTDFIAPDENADPNPKIGATAYNAFTDSIDAQYVRFDDASPLGLRVGYIAHPAAENAADVDATQSQRRLDNASPYFEISGVQRTVVGDTVHKVGYTTGWTSGQITDTCTLLIVYPNTYPCTDWGTFYGAGGDSGALVFSIGSDGRVVPRGIHIAGDGIIEVLMPIDQVLDGLYYDRGFNFVWVVPPLDYDSDGDGLIEVSTLAQLHAIRWDLDGDGVSDADGYVKAFPHATSGLGCPDTGCSGYELANDLDLDTDGDGSVDLDDAHWNDGAGWGPIADASSGFTANFDGNGHAIANLLINRPDTNGVGLFGITDIGSVVRNVGLTDTRVIGGDTAGALVGENSGRVQASFSTGIVHGGDEVGGLVGSNAMLGTIASSYSSASVSGDDQVGGLVGSSRGAVSNTYATGSAASANDVGGLIGALVDPKATITNSYATGAVDGDTNVGGLVGRDATGSAVISHSYWNTETSGQSSSAGGLGKTRAELNDPTGATGIYADWNPGEAVTWDFGTSGQYPVLVVDTDDDSDAAWQEFGDQHSPSQPIVSSTVSGRRPIVSAARTIQAIYDNSAEGATYQWQRRLSSGWRDVGPGWAEKRVKFNSTGTRTYRVVVTRYSEAVFVSHPVALTWRLPEITVTPSDRTPVIGQAINVTADVESGGARASSFHWERQSGDEWRPVGPEAATKRIIFRFAETATYRAAVTLTTGQVALSEPITLGWRTTSVDVTASATSLVAGHLATLQATVTTVGEGKASSYQWQYQRPGVLSWVEIGNDRDNLVISHGGGGLREYRLTVTMSAGEEVTSDPVPIAWQDP